MRVISTPIIIIIISPPKGKKHGQEHSSTIMQTFKLIGCTVAEITEPEQKEIKRIKNTADSTGYPTKCIQAFYTDILNIVCSTDFLLYPHRPDACVDITGIVVSTMWIYSATVVSTMLCKERRSNTASGQPRLQLASDTLDPASCPISDSHPD